MRHEEAGKQSECQRFIAGGVRKHGKEHGVLVSPDGHGHFYHE